MDSRSFHEIVSSAEAGNPESQYELAAAYREGERLEQDFKQALKWYSRAAEAGHLDALNDLGSMLLNGMGCPKDASAAAACYGKAAAAGHTEGTFNLALRYLHGDGVEMGAEYAASLLSTAAEAGHLEAIGQLGTLHMLGNGVEQNFEAAATFHWIAAREGDVTSIGNLASYRGKLEDLALCGKQSIAVIRGQMLSRGWGDPPLKARAFAWYRWAAEMCVADDDSSEEVEFWTQMQASLEVDEQAERDAAFAELQVRALDIGKTKSEAEAPAIAKTQLPKVSSFHLAEVFPNIERIIKQMTTPVGDFLSHEVLATSMLSDEACRALVDAACRANGKTAEWNASNMIAWFSHWYTRGEKVQVNAIERQKSERTWAYRSRG